MDNCPRALSREARWWDPLPGPRDSKLKVSPAAFELPSFVWLPAQPVQGLPLPNVGSLEHPCHPEALGEALLFMATPSLGLLLAVAMLSTPLLSLW